MIFGSPMPGITYKERVAAYALIFSNEGAIATVEGKSGFFLPGGGSHPNEAPEETVVREVREELARTVHLVHKIGEAIQYFAAEGQHYRMHAVFFLAEFTSTPSGPGEHTLHWLPVTEAKERLFHPCHAWAAELAWEAQRVVEGQESKEEN